MTDQEYKIAGREKEKELRLKEIEWRLEETEKVIDSIVENLVALMRKKPQSRIIKP